MINKAVKIGFFKAKWVGADSAFWRSKAFLKNLPDGMQYFVDILSNMKIYPMINPRGSGIAATESIPVSEVAVDENIPWKRIILAEGSKGQIIAEEKCIQTFENYSEDEKKRETRQGVILDSRTYNDKIFNKALHFTLK